MRYRAAAAEICGGGPARALTSSSSSSTVPASRRPAVSHRVARFPGHRKRNTAPDARASRSGNRREHGPLSQHPPPFLPVKDELGRNWNIFPKKYVIEETTFDFLFL